VTLDPATWGMPAVTALAGNEERVSKWRYGEVVLRNGRVVSIQARWWPRWGTVWGAMVDRVVRSLPEDECRFYYSFPRSAPGYMSLLYVHAGEKTYYQTFHQGIEAMDAIAGLRKARAIVCQVTNDRLNDRMMTRWGYVKHAENLGDNHYIRRLKP
jgi:hypothetical protein